MTSGKDLEGEGLVQTILEIKSSKLVVEKKKKKTQNGIHHSTSLNMKKCHTALQLNPTSRNYRL